MEATGCSSGRALLTGMNASPKPRSNFRPEVQALRAVAVLLVVAYHLEPRLVPGGFIGVDVFFAISGFLITGHLLREVSSNGRINLPAFWAARARRILPAALVVIVVVLAMTLTFVPWTQWKGIGSAALSSALSVENWRLAANSVDYLAADLQPTALQHFWSLGVEEQFYLVWPLLVLLGIWLGRVLKRRGREENVLRRGAIGLPRTTLLVIFSLVILASLASAIEMVGAGNPAAYFVTQARVWEMAAGGMLALLLAPSLPGAPAPAHRWFDAPGASTLLAWGGFATIGVAAFGFDAQTPFPGLTAMFPVVGTLAVILAGKSRGPFSPSRILEAGAVQWVGNVSYSLYLWHWPVITFFLFFADREPGPMQSVGLLALSLLLAAGSHRWIENPVRKFAPLTASNWRALGAGAVAVSMVVAMAFAPGILADRQLAGQERVAASLLASPPPGFGAASVPEGAPAFLKGVSQIVPVPALAESDRPDLGECVQKPDSLITVECSRGVEDGALTIALVGDSHATHWYVAMEAAAKRRGWTLLTYLKNSCPFSATQRIAEAKGSISCSPANKDTLERILERGDVDAVVTGHWAGANFEKGAAEGFAQFWGSLEDAGIKVYPIVDTPRPGKKAPARDCVVEHPTDLGTCGAPVARAFEAKDATRAAATLEPRVGVLDFSDQFCTGGFCPAVIGNVLVYRDKHHVSDTYARTLRPVFDDRLESLMRADGLLTREP